MDDNIRIIVTGPWDGPPYAYYKIRKVYKDGSDLWVMCYVWEDYGIETTVQIAVLLSGLPANDITIIRDNDKKDE